MARRSELTNSVDKQVGQAVSMLRVGLGLSRQDLAGKIGISHQQLQKYETGSNRITAGRLFAIGIACKKPPAYFFEGVMPESDETVNIQHRMCIEVSLNFIKIKRQQDREAVHKLIKTLSNCEVANG